MFITNPNVNDYRYWIIDEKHNIGKQILTISRRAASKHIKNQDNAKEKEKLLSIFKNLDLGEVNALSSMYMISTKWNGATGQGGIWACASEIINALAKQELKNRPMVEVI